MTTSHIGTTPSEQMFFNEAPLAHVVLYYDRRRAERFAILRQSRSAHDHRRTLDWLASIERERLRTR